MSTELAVAGPAVAAPFWVEPPAYGALLTWPFHQYDGRYLTPLTTTVVHHITLALAARGECEVSVPIWVSRPHDGVPTPMPTPVSYRRVPSVGVEVHSGDMPFLERWRSFERLDPSMLPLRRKHPHVTVYVRGQAYSDTVVVSVLLPRHTQRRTQRLSRVDYSMMPSRTLSPTSAFGWCWPDGTVIPYIPQRTA